MENNNKPDDVLNIFILYYFLLKYHIRFLISLYYSFYCRKTRIDIETYIA